MEFELHETSVNCIRTKPNGTRDVVISFDAHLNDIAPHVRGMLTNHELRELRQWFESQRELTASPTEGAQLFDRLQSLALGARLSFTDNGHIDQNKVDEIQGVVNEIHLALAHAA